MRFDLPTPDAETEPFWDACKEGRFLLKHCNTCGEDHFYPRPFCPNCWSDDVAWKEASGAARLYTYSVVRQNDLPPFPDIDEKDPDAGYKILWNLAYAYYAGGNSHNWTALNCQARGAKQLCARLTCQ